jgi:hypothetical protein
VVPLTKADFFRAVAVETAKMSWLGSMSRGKSPVILGETKKVVETYFSSAFPLAHLWESAGGIGTTSDQWHYERLGELANAVGPNVCSPNKPWSVAAKFINTFLHQLQKCDAFRPIRPFLHLPLDNRIFRILHPAESDALSKVRPLLRQSPYRMEYSKHIDIQQALLAFLAEMNCRPGAEFQFKARIDLNLLWVTEE